MKKLITIFNIFLTLSLYSQNNNPIRDIRYYNSLEWKNANSFVVYIDCTYTLPVERKIVKHKYANRNYIIPYKYFYPYNYYRCYPINGFDMGYNRMYYFPLMINLQNNHKQHR